MSVRDKPVYTCAERVLREYTPIKSYIQYNNLYHPVRGSRFLLVGLP